MESPYKRKRKGRFVCSVAVLFSIVILLTKVQLSNPTVTVDEIELTASEVKTWALKFGIGLSGGCVQATCVERITKNFIDFGAITNWDDANKMLEDMRTDVQNMMQYKAEVVKKLCDVAEQAVMKHTYDPNIKEDYYNAKKLYDGNTEGPQDPDWKPMEFLPHKNFDGTPVNMEQSVVHVPTNVYDKAPDVLNTIRWSKEMNPTFKNNVVYDPSLMWQFFGSSTGVMRLYPAVRWRVSDEAPDMYDCRMRPWYIQGAASAKDIVILLDGSGSMTGLRKEIARNVVLNILETLNDNDYVTILRFSESVKSVVPCFENTLVQANEKNLRDFREALKDLETVNIANFTLGLITAFELLQKTAKNHEGSQCNQAIMLITDGAPYTYEKIFQQYNWPNIPVRVFTYLIGREVTDMDEVQWMACNNRGYYTHVTTLAEVREQVQKYIPVMSRPLVLSGEHPIIWSAVYADVSDVKLTDWLWQERERAKIRKSILKEREKRQKEVENLMQAYPEDENGNGYGYQNGYHSAASSGNISIMEPLIGPNMGEFQPEPEVIKKPPKKKTVQLMTTVSTPVYDKRNYSMRVANLLGVAGVDVPIREIIKLTPPYKLGVNGYSFVVTNNGYVLYHPDLRPLFQDMLKPEYNSVDMAEVELVDDNNGPREFDETLLMIKNNTINRRIGWNKLSVKVHLDGMKRVVTRNNSYYYGPIAETPFSLVIVLPEPYGQHRVDGQIEVMARKEDLKHYFRGNNWRVHPDWVYCESRRQVGDPYVSPEDVINKFIEGTTGSPKIKWRTKSTKPPLLNDLTCDKVLVQSLMFDAKATDIDPMDASKKCARDDIPTKVEETVIKIYGIVTTFVATRSGLLRYEDLRTEEEKNNSTERPFYEVHTRATDELFYRRAVDFHYINESAFVISVPFDAGTRNTSLVTASQAIFLGNGKKKAPAAVVGVQMKHSAFVERFFNVTGMCMQGCKYRCTDEDMVCYLLDSNGFIVVSETHSETGKFFGEVDFTLFDSMVQDKIYRKVRMYDYQAICIDVISPSGPSSVLKTPLLHIKSIFYWLWSKIIMLFVQYNLLSWWSEKWASASDFYYDDGDYDDEHTVPNKTRPYPCDKEFFLYEMQPTDSWEPIKGVLPKCNIYSDCDKNYIIQKVPYTNLVMLVVYSECNCTKQSISLELKEIHYDEDVRCQRMRNGTIRRLPEFCTHDHPEEPSIRQQCGMASLLSASIYSMLSMLLHWPISIV